MNFPKLFSFLVLGSALSFSDVLLDDMEGERLNQARSGGYWFLILDAKSHQDANSQLIFPPDLNFRFHDTAGYGGSRGARIHVKIGSGYRYPFAGIGFNIDNFREPVDFLKVHSVRFLARGKGTFRLKIRDVWSTRQTPNANFEHDFIVSPEWQVFDLETKDFRVPRGSPYRREGKTWEDVADSVISLIFTTASYQDRDAGTEIRLDLDLISLVGIDSAGASTTRPPKYPQLKSNRHLERGIREEDFDDAGSSEY